MFKYKLYRYGRGRAHLDARGRVHLVETRGTWLRLKKFGRMTRPMTHLAETAENLAEAAKTTRIWPMADPYHGSLADGRTLLQLTLKPRSVKLIHPQKLGNATLSGNHLDKRAQQGRPIRII